MNKEHKLIAASIKNGLEAVKRIVDSRAVNIQEVLNHACYYGYLEVVKYCVEHGADINYQKDKALGLVGVFRHKKVIQYLKNRIMLEKLQAV